MKKYNLITGLYFETLNDITSDKYSWQEFLDCASSNFKYNFRDQVLIYAQKPNAIAVAELEQWNRYFKRWVNRGAKGIFLLDESNSNYGMRCVFDVTDTNQYGMKKEYPIWKYEEKYNQEIVDILQATFGKLEYSSNIETAICSTAYKVVQDNLQDYINDFKEKSIGTSLELVSDFELELNIASFIEDSVAYMTLKRCNLDIGYKIPSSGFDFVSQLTNYKQKIVLGNAVSRIADETITVIRNTITKLQNQEKIKNRTFDEQNKKQYNVSKLENEGRENYESNIYRSKWLSNTESNSTKTGESSFGQIRTDEIGIFKGTQISRLRNISNEQNFEQTLIGNTETSNRDDKNNNESISTERQPNRGDEKQELSNVGGNKEQPQVDSRRTSNAGSNLQLNNNIISKVISPEEQIENIRTEVEAEIAPTFAFTQEMIDSVLQEGSHFANGKNRIYRKFQESLSTKDNIVFLKNEYGTGGSSLEGFEELDVWYDSKGIRITKGFKEDAPEILLTWNKVEKRIRELIKTDRYLNNVEKEKYEKWLKEDYENEKWMLNRDDKQIEQENEERENIISNEESIEKVYKYDIGTTVYLGIDEFEVTRISDDYISISDKKFPLLTKDISTEKFEQMLKDNPFNEGLLVEKTTEPITENSSNTENIEKNYKLSNGNYFHFHTNEEGYYYAIYNEVGNEIDGGLLEYSDIDEQKQSIEDIRKRLAEFTDIEELANNNLKEVSQKFIDNLESEATLKETDKAVIKQVEDNTIKAVEELNPPKEPEFKIGQVVYLESNKQFRIEAINKEYDKIELMDYQLYKNGYPIFRNESYSRFLELYNKNERNFKQQNKQSEQVKTNKINYTITDDNLGDGTPKERLYNNIEAIKTLKKLESENRLANPEEQQILAKYVGWGGLADVFDESKENWHNEYVELKELLTDEEYEKARESTLTSFYTPPYVIKSIYNALERMGLKEANILEPSCGTGNFLGMLPENLQNCKMYGIELDEVSGKIAKQLYQKSNIQITGYENADLPDSFFDVAIGNIPFGNFKVADKKYDKNNFVIHDYFFAKTLDKVRAGGVIAFITSKGTMDKENNEVRKYISERAELIGAIRLPDNTFTKNAGTRVTSDIIFLKKREKLIDTTQEWVDLAYNENDIKMNSYYVDHPDMVLGDLKMESTQFGKDDLSCKARENQNIQEDLQKAIQNLDSRIDDYAIEDIEDAKEKDKIIPATPDVKNYSYTLINGEIYYRLNSKMKSQNSLPLTTLNRIKGMMELRDITRELIDLELNDYSNSEIENKQKELNNKYDEYIKKYGQINDNANKKAFEDDSSYVLLSALEVWDNDTKSYKKADMFYKRTIKPHKVVDKVDTANEALILSISEKAKVDLEYMQQISGKSKDDLVKELEGVIFKVPDSENEIYQNADEYLSGNIREKLNIAKLAVKSDDRYKINVEALTKVMPKDLTPVEISVRLGATWIPKKYIEDFMFELLETPFYLKYDNIKVQYFDYTGEWNVEGKTRDKSNVKANTTYGTRRKNAYEIIEDTLNLRDTRVYDLVEDENGNKVSELNKQETAIAQQKQEAIKQAFQDWIWKEQDRRNDLVKIYNTRFNSIRPREYDGSYINFQGMNSEIDMQEHQRNAIAHVLYGGNTLLAHEVGAGKTFEMVASAMESKRLGLCTKSLFVVPNHIIDQIAGDFIRLYPNANILVATKKDFATQNRKRFCSKIATGDYDAIIIGHSQFEKIPMSKERQENILKRQINEILQGIEDVKESNGERFTIKQLEKSKKKLELKLKKLNDATKKDDVITFEELGVDRIFVDEAHYYKNLYLYSKMRNVSGIAQTEAQKSSDLFMKTQYLDEITGGKGVIFATGTPISNSMVELYTMQRYLQYNTLRKHHLQNFDAWASTFGETITSIELTPEGKGYRPKIKFAKFYNLPELMSMFKEVADIKTADTLNLPVPKVNFKTEVIKPTDFQKKLVEGLGERAEKIRQKLVNPKEDNMLKITNDGRKLALDQRMINNMLPDDENSKISVCANNVYEIWKDTKEQKSTQLIFCDLSTPKTFRTQDNPYEMEQDENGVWKLKEIQFTDAYTDIKRKLILKGIPEDEIEFIHNADTEVKKEALFEKVRNGEIRVLLGSTQKMGAGTNVQNKLIAMHDLDCPWRPADLTQRLGRIQRRGNENKEVTVIRYVTEGTFDAYLYQLVETKQKFISQIMTSKTPVRSAEDVDESVLNYAEIKALAVGNPHIIEKTKLEADIAKLKIVKQSYWSEIYDIQDKLATYYPNEINRLKNRIAGLEKDIKQAEEQTKVNEDGFSPMIINGKVYDKKAEAGERIIAECQAMTKTDTKTLGTYRGFNIELSFDGVLNRFTLQLKNELSYNIELGDDKFGNITRIDNTIQSLSKTLENEKQQLDNINKQYENAKIESQKEFSKEDELKELESRLREVNKLLKINEKAENISADFDDEEIDKQEEKNQDCEKEPIR